MATTHRLVRDLVQYGAEASGIQPASIYHHFPSKEAIAIELLEAYQAELDQIGRAASLPAKSTPPEGFREALCELGDAIADCAVRHHAALQLTMYAPPSGAGARLV
jgi:AcrR family transcriptional regulator